MNFLAHLYLSGDDKEIIFGNFIADMVKGNKINSYSDKVKQGINLHRAIDSYTDSHPIFIQSKNRLKPKYNHYSGVIVDMYYDHFLSKNWEDYSDEPLNSFLSRMYNILIKKYLHLPPLGKKILPFMIANNWLGKYADLSKLQKNFEGMAKRTSFVSGMEDSVSDLLLDYHKYRNEFREFFPQLIAYTDSYKGKL